MNWVHLAPLAAIEQRGSIVFSYLLLSTLPLFSQFPSNPAAGETYRSVHPAWWTGGVMTPEYRWDGYDTTRFAKVEWPLAASSLHIAYFLWPHETIPATINIVGADEAWQVAIATTWEASGYTTTVWEYAGGYRMVEHIIPAPGRPPDYTNPCWIGFLRGDGAPYSVCVQAWEYGQQTWLVEGSSYPLGPGQDWCNNMTGNAFGIWWLQGD